MKAISDSSTAMAEAGKGPPSNTGTSATDSPGTFRASTCSLPLIEVLKMRTLPRTMMCRPEQGSPSEKRSSPAENNFLTVRAASKPNSGCDKSEQRCLFKCGGEVDALGIHSGILAGSDFGHCPKQAERHLIKPWTKRWGFRLAPSWTADSTIRSAC